MTTSTLLKRGMRYAPSACATEHSMPIYMPRLVQSAMPSPMGTKASDTRWSLRSCALKSRIATVALSSMSGSATRPFLHARSVIAMLRVIEPLNAERPSLGTQSCISRSGTKQRDLLTAFHLK